MWVLGNVNLPLNHFFGVYYDLLIAFDAKMKGFLSINFNLKYLVILALLHDFNKIRGS